jgi:hypothetical protein
MSKTLATTLLFGIFVTTALGQEPLVPSVPEKLMPPAGEKLVLYAHASGKQIYLCQRRAGQKAEWSLKAPEATLFDTDRKQIGEHFFGPRWRHKDGSEVTGKVIAKMDSPGADSVPWLLMRASDHSGRGVFDHVTSIQRIHTVGGAPPPSTACLENSLGREAPVPYSADYYFYSPKGLPGESQE